MSIRVGTSYLSDAHLPAEDIVSRARAALDMAGIRTFDTLVGTGLSGALVVPILARAFDCDAMIVRKPNDGAHSIHRAEGRLGSRWVFVDDLIDSGSTYMRVRRTVPEVARGYDHRTTFVGAYLYNYSRAYRAGDDYLKVIEE